MSDISDIPSSPPTFSIEAHSSPRLPPIQSSFFPPQTSNRGPQPPSRSLYSASEGADALLLAAALDVEESDKDDVGVVGMKDGSIELDAQTQLEGHLAFLADDLLSDDGIDEETDWEDYFPSVPVVASNDSSERCDINAMEIDDLPNQKPRRQRGPRRSTIRAWGSFSSTSHAKHKLIRILKGDGSGAGFILWKLEEYVDSVGSLDWDIACFRCRLC